MLSKVDSSPVNAHRRADVRIFGYGSLIWRPAFAYRTRTPASITGYARRFYQGSPDHRGTPQHPGRVVTLVPDPEATCIGMLYDIDDQLAPEILGHLDHREQAGYMRIHIDAAHLDDSDTHQAICYIATAHNPDYLGPAPLTEMARQIANTRGPSGSCRAYLMQLHRWLGRVGVDEPHIATLAEAIQGLTP